jgi:hypothetical protein
MLMKKQAAKAKGILSTGAYVLCRNEATLD